MQNFTSRLCICTPDSLFSIIYFFSKITGTVARDFRPSVFFIETSVLGRDVNVHKTNSFLDLIFNSFR
jgi:hypothetical protein